jgi:hypothetical protein
MTSLAKCQTMKGNILEIYRKYETKSRLFSCEGMSELLKA